MSGTLGYLGQNYGLVILDSPPVALVADALVLASRVDGVLMVVRRGKVDRALASRTLDRIRNTGVRVVGVALNDMPRSEDPVRYGSRYYSDAPRADRPAG